MRHKVWKKYLKIACSWTLIFSMCFLSLNTVNVSAEDSTGLKTESENTDTETLTNDTKTQEKESEQSNEQFASGSKEKEQTTEKQIPDSISVQSLEEELQTSSVNGDADATSTDRVEYVDTKGNAIEGAPTTIELGRITDHKDLSITGKNYEFKSAKVNGKNCVYIGKYEDTIYYSTDGVIAIKLEDGQKLTMTYQEYYNITVKEDIPEGGAAGTITTKAGNLDTSKTVRVNAGEDWNITVTPAVENKVRYKIASIESENNATITKSSGDEYGANYAIQFKKDDVVIISYSSEGVYRVHVKETDNAGNTCIVTDPEHYSDGYINDFTFSESDVNAYKAITLPIFHTIRGKRIVSFRLNGETMAQEKISSEVQEVPTSTSQPITVRVDTPAGNIFDIEIKLVDHYTSDLNGSNIKCSYAYQLTVTLESGVWEDLNFVPVYGDTDTPTLSVKALTENSAGRLVHSDAGMEIAYWDYSDENNKHLEAVKDGDILDMSPTNGIARRQVRIFFVKAKAGYSLGVIAGDRTSGSEALNETYVYGGKVENLKETSIGDEDFTNFKNNYAEAKKAAQNAGYTNYLIMTGETGGDGIAWDLYYAEFTAKRNNYYVLYDKGNLPDSAVVSNMPTSDVMTSSSYSRSNQYTDLPVFGARAFGETFKVGEGFDEPKCDGYKFVGWKLKDSNDKGEDIYQNNVSFTIDSTNVEYGDLDFCVKNSGGGLNLYHNAYRFVAQWEKVGSRNVKVNHYLKVPDGTENLAKVTEGTISFAKNNETVTALGTPEPEGTFSGYVFDKSDTRNTLEKTVTNDGSTDTIELNLYYKPTALIVSKVVTGYNFEPDRSFTFTIQANAPSGTTENAATIGGGQVYIKKGSDAEEKLAFTNNKATFNLKKDESVDISCLPTGWTYTIKETDAGSNYRTKYKLNTDDAMNGTEVAFTMASTGTETVEFTNASKIAPPTTGRRIYTREWMILLMLALCVGVSYMLICKKNKRKYH